MVEKYSVIIFSAFICSGYFSPRIGDVIFMLGDGVAVEVGVPRFIGIGMDVGVGMGGLVGRLTPWWCYSSENGQISGFDWVGIV